MLTQDCLLNRLFRLRSKKALKFRVTGLCAGNSPVTGVFPTQMASNTENVSIWWRHHGKTWPEQIEHRWDFPLYSMCMLLHVGSHMIPRIGTYYSNTKTHFVSSPSNPGKEHIIYLRRSCKKTDRKSLCIERASAPQSASMTRMGSSTLCSVLKP